MKKSSSRAGKSLTILVLDDNRRWRQIVKSMLESDLGISPFLASSGGEALEIVKTRSIDVVVTDLNMPGMNGVQFLECVRPKSPGTKVIIISADLGSCRTMSQALIARGAFTVIRKDEIAPNLVNHLRTLQGSK